MAEAIHPIDTSPKAGQTVTYSGTTYTTIKEGLAYILVPPNARTTVNPQAKTKPQDESEKPQNVFYNPIQQFNRDLSVLAIKAFGDDLCERRSQKALVKGEMLKRKKDRKKHARQERNGEEGAKRRKANDGSALATDSGEGSHETGLDLNMSERPPLQEGDAQANELAEISRKDTTEAAPNETQQSKETESTEATDQKASKPQFRILDALSATGLRALRYAQEISSATSITANDLLAGATASIAMNVKHNRLESKITPTTSNAVGHMYNAAFGLGGHEYDKYDVIDLDPYGTAAPFLDAAIQAISDNGLLCVTCTDAGVWASCGYVEKTYALYGGLPLKGPHSHEAGLRLILHSIASAAAKNGIAIEPLLSLSIDFYARVFVRVRKSPADVKLLAGKTMLVHQCDHGCGAWSTQMLGRNQNQTGAKGGQFFKHSASQTSSNTHCDHCDSKTHVAGPMWSGPLHNPYFIAKILGGLKDVDKDTYATVDRIEGMLTSALDELDVLSEADGKLTTNDKHASEVAAAETAASPLVPMIASHIADTHPFFFVPSALAKVLHCQSPPEAAIKGALRHAGYKATRSHTKPGCIKTEAPWTVIWEVMREWVRQKAPVKEGALRDGSAGAGLMKRARRVEQSTTNGDTESGSLDNSDVEMKPADVETKADTTAKAGGLQPHELKIVFDEVLGKDRDAKRLLRYQLNPRANWGPMARAKGSAT